MSQFNGVTGYDGATAKRRKSSAAKVNRCVGQCTTTEVGFTLEQLHAMVNLFSAMIESHEANRGTK